MDSLTTITRHVTIKLPPLIFTYSCPAQQSLAPHRILPYSLPHYSTTPPLIHSYRYSGVFNLYCTRLNRNHTGHSHFDFVLLIRLFFSWLVLVGPMNQQVMNGYDHIRSNSHVLFCSHTLSVSQTDSAMQDPHTETKTHL